MRILLIFFIAIVKAGIIYSADNKTDGSSEIFSKEILQSHLYYLGSDLLEGRGTGTQGGNQAAKYLAEQFSKLKLVPAGDNNTFYQYIPMHGSVPLESSKLKIINDKDTSALRLHEDYLLYKGGEQTFIPDPLQMVFAGYGIVAPEYDYNDYQSIDVAGKIVVLLDGEPLSEDNEYFEGQIPTVYSSSEAKQRIAISRGARGSIIIPGFTSDWGALKQIFSFEDITLAYSVSGNLSVLLNPEAAGKIFQNSQYSLDEIYRMHFQNRVVSFPLSSSLAFEGVFRERDFVSPNIAGILPGRDPELADSYLLLTAHYDHLGIGPAVNGDSIYNGVFDNAIGTAALLEVARAFVSLNNTPRRSILFVLLTGEEKGLLGSTYYTQNPLVPLYKTIANVNVDGIALYDNFKSIIGIGAEYSTIGDYLSEAAKENNVNITSIPPQFEDYESFSKSDQVAFALAGIPSVLVSEAPDYANFSKDEALKKLIHYATDIYHSPFDDLNQDMNFNAAVQHINIIYDLCKALANTDEEPEWNPGSFYINARLRSIAEKR